MKHTALTRTLLAAGVLLAALPAQAETINLQQAVEMSLAADPRIKEREQVIEAARGMLQEVQGNAGWRMSANAFIGLAPKVEGGFYQNGEYSGTTPRTDGDRINGISDWTHLDFALIKPLYTFGKVERYGEAAQGNIDLKRGELKQTRGDTVYDTKRAYFGYLTARDWCTYLASMPFAVCSAYRSDCRDSPVSSSRLRSTDSIAQFRRPCMSSRKTRISRAVR
jgi:outer membrane protein TolC